MGNHEYCTGCGASDFHSGMSCKEAYPEKWAEKEKQRKEKQAIVDKENARVEKLVKATLAIGGTKAVVNRLLKIEDEEKVLVDKLCAIKQKINRLKNEEHALRKHCPHPRKYINDGFMYVSCNLCGEVDI